ncbi:MAG: 2-succinyl-5-enolpyruvyl-6-hydroxy-3-cyclohexene-1-carboxylic-acid synthase [Bdellovibrionaceae bacterium]|nr:2-succinyl-5-enolpyruvyl-6-hydroxy-3-cyclohexene-1-carboxylic-acid synthase [Bdellovibrionales bacterium]MCB9084956.1 2-succinyl-5-enolpyruvyl-6-hydroxy-3-cyclohexene-1-carboxylic-acid synthase [Pseudobdellovibrionaceae bacterium]
MKQMLGAQKLLTQLAHQGVAEVLLCAGARNAPLVKALSVCSGLQVLPFFDERAAAFFALGRIRRTNCPVAVVTTSGTAAAELLPATIEAWYSGLPLVLVTADRPPNYRGTGAPQAIEQVGIFSTYVQNEFDFLGEEPGEITLADHAPTHINVSFDEPLIDGELGMWTIVPRPGAESDFVQDRVALSQDRVQEFLQNCQKPLIVVSELPTNKRELVIKKVLEWKRPVYLEASSGLYGRSELKPWRLNLGEGVFKSSSFMNEFDGVIRIGGIPTTRLWRDLESKLGHWPVLSFSQRSFSGLARIKVEPLPLAALELIQGFSQDQSKWLDCQQAQRDRLKKLLETDPHSEPAVFYELARMIPSGSHVFLGNSLPIREWDLVAGVSGSDHVPMANRGANGIDGLIATFLGSATADQENWLILGDLSALYDLNAPWALRFCQQHKIRIVVINNRGGQIFRRLFADPLFENQHSLSFESFAEMWGLDYHLWRRVPEKLPELAKQVIIEIRPNDEATQRFWQQYEQMWKDH